MKSIAFSSFSLIYILVLYINQIKTEYVDLSFSKQEPIEVEDLCLRRPYHKTAEPYYFIPVLRSKLKEVGEKYSFPSRCFKKNIINSTKFQ